MRQVVYRLSDIETVATFGATGIEAEQIKLGANAHYRGVKVCANTEQVLGRHPLGLNSRELRL
ncbi:UNVERIFIED_ORG: hypothetical protein ABID33_003025 [Xanthobacter viscosus]|uniref:Uncharacterized protein n=2 Tax=Xanthobacter autotrophicus TaxID=280 RepID=A0A6C1K989_XANAU|nr:hypothetical protein [Xanthobacter autotrophicus]TLX40849.1 hypothetical protein FBQ73_20535 [Xanthobacter autotrophicus]